MIASTKRQLSTHAGRRTAVTRCCFMAAVMLPVAGWARVRLSAHTFAQVVAGSLVGALIAATVYPFLTRL